MKLYTNRIFIGADHAGFNLKKSILSYLEDSKCIVQDVGTFSEEKVDYTDYAAFLVKEMLSEQDSCFGILLCGSGIGMSIAANRHPKIRAALCHTEDYAKVARMHNDANVLTIGARYVEPSVAFNIVQTFITTPFEGGRHIRRLEKLEALSSLSNTVPRNVNCVETSQE